MAFYLRMNGTSDYLKIPNTVTFGKIVADVKIRRKTDIIRVLWDFRTGVGFGYLQQQTNGTDAIGRGTVKINGGANATNGTAFIPNNVRCVIEHDLGITGFDNGSVFVNNQDNAGFIDGDIFNIKLYNGTTLVAHYDMATGTVQDQTGNGHHATLTGGTWLETPKYYLQMDGVDDNLYTPTITFNEVIMNFESTYTSDRVILDARTGGSAYVAWTSTVNKMQCFNTQYYVNGSLRTSEDMGIGNNQKVELRLVLNTTTTDDVRIFSANSNFNRAAGKIWFVKFLNAGSVVAHYDISTGTINDISGNNRHATLVGGTWVEDGGGGTGTPGTTTANTKQIIYEPKQASIDLKQAVYKNGLIIADMLQTIQGNNVSIVNMRQVVYKQGQAATNTKQDIYKPGQIVFNMKQAVYKTGIAYANLLQLIQSINNVTIETKQVIYKQATADFNTLQRMYKSGSNNVDLLVRVLENYKVYENIFEMIFKINTKVETEFSIKKEIETEFKIIQELNKTFKI